MNKFRFAIIALLLVSLSSIVFFWLFFGLGDFIKATQMIKKLPIEQRLSANAGFMGSDDNPYLYGGILAGVNTKFFPGVWVWGRNGLKYFRSDNYSVYSYFSICNQTSLQAFEKKENFRVDRTIDTDIKKWGQKTKTGQFVLIMITSPENGGTLGNLREAKGHDWWGFTPIDIKKQCEK